MRSAQLARRPVGESLQPGLLLLLAVSNLLLVWLVSQQETAVVLTRPP